MITKYDFSDLENILPSIAEQVIADTEKLLAKFQQEPLTSDVKEMIKGQIVGIKDPYHKVKQLVRKYFTYVIVFESEL